MQLKPLENEGSMLKTCSLRRFVGEVKETAGYARIPDLQRFIRETVDPLLSEDLGDEEVFKIEKTIFDLSRRMQNLS
jgi:hypothetical protein